MTEYIIIFLGVLLGSLLGIFIVNTILNKLTKSKMSDEQTPLADSIVKGVLFVACSLLLGEMANSFQVLVNVLRNSETGQSLWTKELMYFSLLLGTTLSVHAVDLLLASLMYSAISKGKSVFHEIANDDLGAALLFCGIVLGLTLVAKSGLIPLLDRFIPYPSMPVYH